MMGPGYPALSRSANPVRRLATVQGDTPRFTLQRGQVGPGRSRPLQNGTKFVEMSGTKRGIRC